MYGRRWLALSMALAIVTATVYVSKALRNEAGKSGCCPCSGR